MIRTTWFDFIVNNSSAAPLSPTAHRPAVPLKLSFGFCEGDCTAWDHGVLLIPQDSGPAPRTTSESQTRTSQLCSGDLMMTGFALPGMWASGHCAGLFRAGHCFARGSSHGTSGSDVQGSWILLNLGDLDVSCGHG